MQLNKVKFNIFYINILIAKHIDCLLEFKTWTSSFIICYHWFFFFLQIATPSSSKDLDVTTIYAMIRNTTEIPGPSKGWGRAPGENDTQKADDIERVRLYQNKICHANSSEMTTVDFNESVLDLIGVHVIFKLLFK